MIKRYTFSLVTLLSLCTAISQDFGRMLFYSGVGFNLPFGEVDSKDFSKPGGMANPGFKSDLLFIEYQFKNGFGVGLKSSIAINSVDNKRIEEYIISSGAESANADVKSWRYGDFTIQGSRSLIQSYYQLLNFSLGIGQAFVRKPKEYYSAVYSDGSIENTYEYDGHYQRTIVANSSLSYWIKLTQYFCLIGTIDYTHIPFRASYSSITENVNNSITVNGNEIPSNFQLPERRGSRPFTIYGLSAGVKLGFSF
ncbi:hypothetical protein [Marinoscillum pacificum]|uniref:hypothetical protein n=1 Tax=Marinoscillum pacificum TaxID=392723 RepID=UPI00215879E9|nr:hypothetical protein [Marinoscillum pacificum]